MTHKYIVIGSSGFLGSAFASYLQDLGHSLTTITKAKPLTPESQEPSFLSSVTDLASLSAPHLGNTFIINFAWSTPTGTPLQHPDPVSQFNNICYVDALINLANTVTNPIIVNIGSIEELKYLRSMTSSCASNSRHSSYSAAKYYYFRTLEYLSYSNKIPILHLRLSSILSLDLSRDTYIEKSLRQCLSGSGPSQAPVSNEPYTFTTVSDLPQLILSALSLPLNRAYYIGPSFCFTLSELFAFASQSSITDLSDLPSNSLITPQDYISPIPFPTLQTSPQDYLSHMLSQFLI